MFSATGADEMCNFYIMYWYDPAMGQPTDACTYVQYKSSDYPSDTDEPFLPKTEMDMKLTKSKLLVFYSICNCTIYVRTIHILLIYCSIHYNAI